MKKFAIICLAAFLFSAICFSQNVGIGTLTPTHAKLEVDGAVGNVVGIFGNSSFPGLSLNYGYPELGFNYYFNSGYKTMAAGYASLIGMDPTNGNLYFGNFNSNQAPGPFSDIAGYTERMTLKQNGRFGIGMINPNAQLSVARGNGVDGTAAFFGTTHVSHFNYGSAENTYIRGGKDNALIIIGDGTGQRIAIGSSTVANGFTLSVSGKVITEEVQIQLKTAWPDYVFLQNHKLTPLAELENYIQQHQHLPNIPSAAEVEKNGLVVGDMQKRMMEKIEELILYIIQQDKRIRELEKQVSPNN
jgi:hypothetical protein